MMRLLACVAMVTLPASAAAQGAAVAPPPAPNATQSVLFTLRNVARAQEAFLEHRMRYAPSADSLRFQAEPGVTVLILGATQRGWKAEGMFDKSPGRTCVVYFGYASDVGLPVTRFEGHRPKREGEPACDPM